jgi:DNA-binding response OmpR family regulator
MKKPNEEIRILVIDDDFAILAAIDDVLQLEGYVTETSTKSGEYIEHVLRKGLPDLIILDILLSGHDGRTICTKLKSQEHTKQIPIILISAHPEAKATAFEAGADDFIAKPFDIDQLVEAVARLITR